MQGLYAFGMHSDSAAHNKGKHVDLRLSSPHSGRTGLPDEALKGLISLSRERASLPVVRVTNAKEPSAFFKGDANRFSDSPIKTPSTAGDNFDVLLVLHTPLNTTPNRGPLINAFDFDKEVSNMACLGPGLDASPSLSHTSPPSVMRAATPLFWPLMWSSAAETGPQWGDSSGPLGL